MTDRILMGHGSGGRMMRRLIRDIIAPAFAMESLADAAVLGARSAGKTAFTTDSYVVFPLFFPGGDIGKLAVFGTVNDLAMVGARPIALSAGFILEEGLPLDDLRRVVASMAEAAETAGVRIVTGDTKVVEHGKCDGMFVNTAGIGIVPDPVALSAERVCPGDAVIASGPCGTHGIAVMAERNRLSFDPPVRSDTAPLAGLVAEMLETAPGIRVLRDPTRGGLATTLKEIAQDAHCRIALREAEVPVLPQVRGASDLLGLDPLYVANEGILVAIVEEREADRLLARMRAHPLANQAARIGTVGPEADGKLLLETRAGGKRFLDLLAGEQLPRIC